MLLPTSRFRRKSSKSQRDWHVIRILVSAGGISMLLGAGVAYSGTVCSIETANPSSPRYRMITVLYNPMIVLVWALTYELTTRPVEEQILQAPACRKWFGRRQRWRCRVVNVSSAGAVQAKAACTISNSVLYGARARYGTVNVIAGFYGVAGKWLSEVMKRIP